MDDTRRTPRRECGTRPACIAAVDTGRALAYHAPTRIVRWPALKLKYPMTNAAENQSDTPDPLTVGELITLQEAAAHAGLAYETLLNYVRRGRLRARKMGWMWVTTRSAVDEYLASRSLDNIPHKYRKTDA